MARILEKKGYVVHGEIPEPDLIVVNTCCVTASAEGKSRRMVKQLAERHPAASIIVTGCLAEINPLPLRSSHSQLIILGTADKDRFADFVSEASIDPLCPIETRSQSPGEFGDLGPAVIAGRSRAFLKVQDGCSQGCSYCIVPKARGKSRSLPPHRTISHALELEESGCAEIVLTGVHLGRYGVDLTPRTSLEELIERLLSACEHARFRFSSVEPQEITDALVRLAAENPRVCRHFHIPLQSGDDAILQRMGRPYRASLVVDLADRIRERSEATCIGLDVMVGFPGEDERSFAATHSLIERIEPAYLHVFPFSPRPGTPATSFHPKVSQDQLRQRVEELRTLSADLRRRFFKSLLGMTLYVVSEKSWNDSDKILIARSDNYVPVRVRVPPNTPQQPIFSVKLETIVDEEVWGTAVAGSP